MVKVNQKFLVIQSHCTALGAVKQSVSMFLYQKVSAKVQHSATRPHRHCHCLQKQSPSPHSQSRGAKETLPRAIVMLRPDMSGQLKGFYTRKEVASHSRVANPPSNFRWSVWPFLAIQYTVICDLVSTLLLESLNVRL